MARVEGPPTVRKAMYAIEHGKVVGTGSFRRVFQTKGSRWVYKVNKYSSIDWGLVGGNAMEWETYNKAITMVNIEGVKIPEMHYLNGGILAAEYVKGHHPDNSCYRDYHDEFDCPGVEKCWSEKIKDLPFSDLSCDNVIITDDGTIYLVDLGLGESSTLPA